MVAFDGVIRFRGACCANGGRPPFPGSGPRFPLSRSFQRFQNFRETYATICEVLVREFWRIPAPLPLNQFHDAVDGRIVECVPN